MVIFSQVKLEIYLPLSNYCVLSSKVQLSMAISYYTNKSHALHTCALCSNWNKLKKFCILCKSCLHQNLKLC